MKICYLPKKFRRKSLSILSVCNAIIEDYRKQGYEMTLRQLYYQMIAGDHFPDTWVDEEYNRKHGLEPNTKNTDKNYDKFGSLISDARLAGLTDWDAIVDNGRALRGLAHWNKPSDIFESAAAQFNYDRWQDQPTRVEVWVEKDALSGVVGRPANHFDVPFFACKGYTSQSEMWGAAQRLMHHMKGGQDVIILHLGDHDPSGVDMTRDIQDRLAMFCVKHGFEPPDVQRIALTMEQIHQYNPPPNPAKLTDCRANRYIEEYGRDSWELDALTPKVMDDLISSHIQTIMDKELFDAQTVRQDAARAELAELSSQYDNLRAGQKELENIHTALERTGFDTVDDLAACNADYNKELTEKEQALADCKARRQTIAQDLADLKDRHFTQSKVLEAALAEIKLKEKKRAKSKKTK